MLVRTAATRRLSSSLIREARRSIPRSVTSLQGREFQAINSVSSNQRWFSASPAAAAVEETAAGSAPFVSTPERKYEYFQNVEMTDSGVAIIRFDCPGKSVNTISFALADEAKVFWKNEIENNSQVKAVVFASAKPNMFIAGADIFDLKNIENKQDLIPIIQGGVDFFQHMKKKNVPLVCAIDGPCLGGGLEWALWCDYRVCTDSSKTKLGLPEVKLGLLPGFGGTQNLPALVGLQAAMDMMLTGKDIRPPKAKKMGLVDMVVAPASLEQVAIESAVGLADGSLKIKRKPKSLPNRLLEDTPMGRNLMWKKVKEMVDKNTRWKLPISVCDYPECAIRYRPSQRKVRERTQAVCQTCRDA